MKKTFLLCILSTIVGIIAGVGYQSAESKMNEDKEFLLKLLQDYYVTNEVLLDSICAWDANFLDTTAESDAYFNYTLVKSDIEHFTNK